MKKLLIITASVLVAWSSWGQVTNEGMIELPSEATSSNVTCERIIKKIENNKFHVEINIKNGVANAFTKLQDDIPEGYMTKKDKTSGAVFSFVNNKAKFLWMGLPNDNVKVSYLLIPKENKNVNYKDLSEISGVLNYVDNTETTRKLPIKMVSIFMDFDRNKNSIKLIPVEGSKSD